jgi:amino acid adenylation domain-containing protein
MQGPEGDHEMTPVLGERDAVITTALALPDTGLRRDWRNTDLATVLMRSAERNASRVALVVDRCSYTYANLVDRARRLATLLVELRGDTRVPELGAVVASRRFDSFVAVMGTLFSRAAYVPLSPKFPPAQTEHMLRASGARTLAIESEDLNEPMLSILDRLSNIGIVVTDLEDVRAVAARLRSHHVTGAREIALRPPIEVQPIPNDAMAYLMFTSGSTGLPKGVMVSHGNVMACLTSFGDRFAIDAEDRFTQNFELTFDLSVFDMFLCWTHGASLFVPPPSQRACPAALVPEAGITIWFSVPSMALFMQQMRALTPGAFPSLRWSLFCGERLPFRVAAAFAEAAPNSVVENLYGPTEVTVACTAHTFDPRAVYDATLGSVPIGKPLPGMSAALVNDALAPVAPGQPGELCLAGEQVALGYWHAPDKIAERFVRVPWDPSGRLWYRTGDLVTRAEGDVLVHLGRLDDQVKVRGYRIELGEVEFALRRVLNREQVAALGLPSRNPDVLEIVAFVAGGAFDEATIRTALDAILPAYMHPSHFVSVHALPLSSNGKIDKGELRRIYREAHVHA